MKTDYDLIIAGAGIAGMITAASAAKHSHQNLKILVIDRNPRDEAGKKTSTGWVCGDAVSQGSLDYLQREVGISYGKPELEHEIHGVVAYSPDHESKAMFDGEGHVLNRRLFPQRQLRDAEKLGVEFQFDAYADSLVVDDGFIHRAALPLLQRQFHIQENGTARGRRYWLGLTPQNQPPDREPH